MTDHTFTTYSKATAFAKQTTINNNKTVKVVRSGDVYIVCVDVSMTSESKDESTQQKDKSQRSTHQTNSGPSSKNGTSSLTPVAARKTVRKKQKIVGLSAAAAKRSAASKNKKNLDSRSMFITKDIEPREISGGLPSLGKRK